MGFNKGDLVQMKSGGPRMTVLNVTDQTVTCQWFAKEKATAQAFDAAVLVAVPATVKRGPRFRVATFHRGY